MIEFIIDEVVPEVKGAPSTACGALECQRWVFTVPHLGALWASGKSLQRHASETEITLLIEVLYELQGTLYLFLVALSIR